MTNFVSGEIALFSTPLSRSVGRCVSAGGCLSACAVSGWSSRS